MKFTIARILTAVACLAAAAATSGCASDPSRAASGKKQTSCALILVKAGEPFEPNTNDYISVKRSLEPLFATKNISIEPDIRRAPLVATIEWRDRADTPNAPDLVIRAVETNPRLHLTEGRTGRRLRSTEPADESGADQSARAGTPAASDSYFGRATSIRRLPPTAPLISRHLGPPNRHEVASAASWLPSTMQSIPVHCL